MSNLQIDGSLYSYADGTALIVTGDTWESVIEVAENSMKKIIEWFSNNNLLLYYNNKTVCLSFSNSIKTYLNIFSIKSFNPTCKLISQCNCTLYNYKQSW